MSGRELFETLVTSSGLPEHYVRPRLEKMMADKELVVESLSVDDVREMLSDLLLDLINEAELSPTSELI